MWDVNQSKLFNKIKTKFEFIKSYCGSTFLLIHIARCQINNDSFFVNTFQPLIYSYSICGFFVLIAFLFTYQLLVEIINAQSYSQLTGVLVKFFINRWLRIYFGYIIFYPLFIYFAGLFYLIAPIEYESDFIKIASLGYPGGNHFWPIPCVLKYCLFIPVFCLTIRLLGNVRCLLLIVSLCWIIYDRFNNVFNLQPDDFNPFSPSIIDFKTHFAIFFTASQAALSYYIIEQSQSALKLLESKLAQQVLNIFSIFLFICGIENRSSIAGFYWSIVLLICMLNESNAFIKCLNYFNFLKIIGKLSLKFYYLHILSINFIQIVVYIFIRPYIFSGVRFDLIILFTSFYLNFFLSLLLHVIEKFFYKNVIIYNVCSSLLTIRD